MFTIITTCVNYDDYLKLTLPHAVKWGRVIVVTDTNDYETAKLVQEHGAELYVTDAFYRNGDRFNKGRALNEAIQHVKPDGWLLLLDSDIILPPPPSDSPTIESFDKRYLFGCRRVMCDTETEWMTALRVRNWLELPLSPLPPVRGLGKKRRVWGSRRTKNPVGIQGYFQLWHYPTYPHKLLEYRTAKNYDVDLGLKWPDDYRVLVPWPVYTVIHLGPRKKNWSGRITSTWDAEPIPAGELELAAEKQYG